MSLCGYSYSSGAPKLLNRQLGMAYPVQGGVTVLIPRLRRHSKVEYKVQRSFSCTGGQVLFEVSVLSPRQ